MRRAQERCWRGPGEGGRGPVSGSLAGLLAGLAAGLVAGLLGFAPNIAAAAEPGAWELRSPLRDHDGPTTVIAGDADGAATVMNPANLGFLRGLNGVISGAIHVPRSGRRGSGVGAFVGLPLGLRALGLPDLAALGVGYQVLLPGPPGPLPALALGRGAPFHKLTVAVALPLGRWIRGLSLGLAGSRLVSAHDPAIDGLTQLDLAAAYRVHRRIALGLVARGLNAPRIPGGEPWERLPIELDPELTLRPLGSDRLELAAGGRILPVAAMPGRWPSSWPGAWPGPWQPRGRARLALGPVALFSEVEGLSFGAEGAEGALIRVRGLRWISGLAVDLRHLGVAGGVVGGLGGGIDGGGARIRLSREAYDAPAPRPREVLSIRLGEHGGERRLARLIAALEALPAGAMLVVDTRGIAYGWAQTEELREALVRLRDRGGIVVAYLEGGSLGTYYLASAATRIVGHPERRLAIVGIHAEIYYFAELLGKLGVRGEFLRIAEYKARPETFELTTASPAVAEQRELFFRDLEEPVLAAIASDRGILRGALRQAIDAAPLAPEDALARGFFDALAHPDALEGDLEAWLGRPLALRAMKRPPAHDHRLGSGPQIAVIHVEGILRRGKSLRIPGVDQRIAGADTLCAAIDRAREDRRIRAIVVRIASIGGSVAAGAAITRALERAAERKPVIVSFGDIAASGGYYVATAGSMIFSDALTSTGSIGVFRPKLDLSRLLERLGIGVDVVDRGAVAGLGAWTLRETEAQRAAALAGIEASYRIFTRRVAAARGLDEAAVDRLARGRIWRGHRAIDRGLADRDGGLHDAITYARGLLGRAGSRAEVLHLPAEAGLLGGLLGRRGGGHGFAGAAAAEALGAAALEPVILGPLRPILRHLPVNLWLSPTGDELMMAELFIAEPL